MMGKAYKKAQSAMEYLMTYGWAILIIAIVLAALFSLGVFSSSSFLGTTCVASSGYLCQSPLLHAGSLTFTFGQSTGTSWTSADVFFIASGSAAPTYSTMPAASGCFDVVSGGLASGQTTTVTANAPAPGGSSTTCGTTFVTTAGTSYSGSVWVAFQTASTSSDVLLSQVATMTLKSS